MKLVFTAHSSKLSHCTTFICKYVFEKGNIPINLFNLYGYFMYGLVSRDKIFKANNELVKKCDELWVFDKVVEGVKIEIDIAKGMGIPIKYFRLKATNDGEIMKIVEIPEKDVEYEGVARPRKSSAS
jgi:hypothetical protein